MSILQQKLIKSLLVAGCAFTFMTSALTPVFAEEEEIPPEILAAAEEQDRLNDAYMRNIRPVHFPPVPYGWQIEVKEDNTVSYYHKKSKKSEEIDTTINMRYTRRTIDLDAAAFMDDYVRTHSCEDKQQQGHGFYTTSCGVTNTYAIVIGEINNMYLIELKGSYSSAASAIIGDYVNSIVSGKKVFKDRNIGEMNSSNKR